MSIVRNKARGCFLLWGDIAEGGSDTVSETIYNYDEAIAAANALDKKYGRKHAICLSEMGQFKSNGKERCEFVEIWWNAAHDSTREPKSRGYGFYVPEVGRKRWIEYSPVVTLGPPDEEIDEDAKLVEGAAGDFCLSDTVDDEEPKWLNLSDYKEAMERARQTAENNKHQVRLYEWCRFSVAGETKTGMLPFWWKNCADLDYIPRRRGIGLTERDDGSPVLVNYEPHSPDPIIDKNTVSDNDDDTDLESDDGEYVTTHCEDCGKVMPLYEKCEYSYEEEVGRSSGSMRFGKSSRRRSSSGGGSSYSSGSSSSYSTGKTYYATRTLVLCEICYDSRIEADKEADRWTVFDWLVVIGMCLALLVGGVFLWFVLTH